MAKYRAIPDGYMTVGEVAKKIGTTVHTLQYYDKEGLLSPSAESDGGRRLYTDKDLVTLHQILSLKSLGFSLDDIKSCLISLETPTEVENALAEQADNMSEKDIINLLFHAGFSTAKTISDVSGRGVGLDVVKSKIESLSGEVEVKSKLGEGSTWIIRLPLTLAIIQALMVTVGGEKYAISLGSIQTLEDIAPSDIKLVQNREVIHLRGSVIPIIRLSEELDIESCKAPDENMTVVIVKKGDKLAGLVIDELMGQQEIVIKSLGKYISKCKIISGATILGDGEVALILDANALI